MSYRIEFVPMGQPPTRGALDAYFEGRDHYVVQEGRAGYRHANTGVYFSFDYKQVGEDGPTSDRPIDFHINYYRPHVFGLEAAPEIDALVRAFDLEVDDPQQEGMGCGPFRIEGFLRGWNLGNRFSYVAMAAYREHNPEYWYPTADIEQAWRWNFRRRAMSLETDNEVIALPILYFIENTATAGGRVMTGTIWPFEIPVFLPVVERVILMPHQVLKANYASANAEPDGDDPDEGGHLEEDDEDRFDDDPPEVAPTVVSWDEIAPVIEDYPCDRSDAPYHQLDYDITPYEIIAYLKTLPTRTPSDILMSIDFEKVLNEELRPA